MFVYLIRNKVNLKCYVGQTNTPIVQRFYTHVYLSKDKNRRKASAIAQAIHKYGVENFEIELLETCDTQALLDEKEIEWILKLNTPSPNGYNIRLGGGGGKLAETTKAKLRGQKRSEATRKKLSDRLKGKPLHPNFLAGAVLASKNRKMPKGAIDGEKNPNVLLTELEVLHIRRIYRETDLSQQAIADIFGVKQVTVSAIVRRKIWKHLQEEY